MRDRSHVSDPGNRAQIPRKNRSSSLTQGHVDKFADFMLKDAKNGNCVRADKFLE